MKTVNCFCTLEILCILTGLKKRQREASDFFSVALGTFFIDYVLSKSNIFKFMITL